MKRFRFTTCLLLALILFSFAGCSTIKKTSNKVTDPFVSKERINLEPFINQLISFIGDIQFGLQVNKPVYIAEYVKTEEVAEYREKFEQFRVNSGKIIAYSTRVIMLIRSDMPELEKVQDLADFIKDLRPFQTTPMEIAFGIAPEKIDEILENTRHQETLLNALKVVQPVVDEVERYMRASVDELYDAHERAGSSVQKNIQAAYTDVQDYLKVNKKLRSNTLGRLQYLSEYRLGERASVDLSWKGDPELSNIVSDKKNITYKHLNDMEAILTGRLALLNRQFEYISPAVDYYLKQKNELNQMVDHGNQTLRKSKMAIIMWGRFHRLMANGVKDPAKFDVFRLMTTAANKAL